MSAIERRGAASMTRAAGAAATSAAGAAQVASPEVAAGDAGKAAATVGPGSSSTAGAVARPVQGLHHFAWRCRDAEETRCFYEDLLGLPLVHVIQKDHVPSTGEFCPYVHIFFRMRDGSCIAFFDLGDGTAALPSPNTPAWVNHIALRVASRDDLLAMKARLEEAQVEVVGITDHDGFIHSIYFFDPNGLRLELTVEVAEADVVRGYAAEAHQALARWSREKPQAASAT